MEPDSLGVSDSNWNQHAGRWVRSGNFHVRRFKSLHFLSPKRLARWFITAFILVGAVGATWSDESTISESSQINPTTSRPNIILLNLDDADCDLFVPEILDSYLPTFGKIARSGLTFDNCHVTTPLCGPSRVCLLRGQYAHRTGIKTNRSEGPLNGGFTGAYPLFRQLGFADDHLGSWMQTAGYRTMMIGKYAHGQVIPESVQGWDDMHISYGGKYFGAVRYSTRYPVGQRRVTPDEGAYRTNQEADEIVWFLDQYAKRSIESASQNQRATPFFMYIAPLAPHQPASGGKMLPDSLSKSGQELRVELTPDFNENDISDKPSHLQTGRLTAAQITAMHGEFQERVLSLVPVDRLMKRLFDKLDELQLVDNTFIFVTSDHGYQLGHNRMIAKKLPYHRNTHVPLFVVGPGIEAARATQLVSHIDLAPTFLEMASASRSAPLESGQAFDGRSLVSILAAPRRDPSRFRKSLLIENWEAKGQLGQEIPATYSAYRTSNTIYTEWANGSREFYDLATDPYQLNNRFDELSDDVASRLSETLHGLKNGVELPLATIATQGLISRAPRIRGFAEDVDGVSGVNVRILNSEGQFFDGDGWQTKPADFTAKLLNPAGLLTEWELEIELAQVSSGQTITIETQSINLSGKASEWSTATFEVDAIAPETNLKLPENNSTVESPVMLFGFATDDHEIRGIDFVLQRMADGFFFDGRGWSEAPKKYVKRLRGHERWHANIVLPPGEYQVTAAAFDEAGNVDPTPSERRFLVK
jgi:arylsulfatase A-like enzyme